MSALGEFIGPGDDGPQDPWAASNPLVGTGVSPVGRRTKRAMKGKAGVNPDRPPSSLRKLSPRALLPPAARLRTLSTDEAQRLERLISEPHECVYDASFALASGERAYAAPLPDGALSGIVAPVDARLLDDGVAEDAAARRKRLLPRGLTREQEHLLFMRMNYARYRLMRLLRAARGARLTLAAARDALTWDERARELRDAIVQANLGLVPTMIERSRVVGLDFSELISEGQLALLRSVSKFDCRRGFKFSTYACRAILSSISRSVALTIRHRNHFPAEFDPEMQKGDALERRRAEIDGDFAAELNRILAANLAELTDAEKRVLRERFGVTGGARPREEPRPKTLRQVAALFGVTKERVRQIQNKALDKIKAKLEEKVFAA